MRGASIQIEIDQVTIILPNGRRLFEIPSCRFDFGAHVLIRGASGKGKTTFLHMLAGLFLPTTGRVRIGPHDLTEMSDADRCALRRQHIGLVFQKLNLLEHLTAVENIILAEGTTRAQAMTSLAAVQMADRQNDRASWLSVGEQQRVAVARVLAAEPDLLFADEPTSSLDDRNAEFVMSALLGAAKGKTLIVVSHDHRVASAFQNVMDFDQWVPARDAVSAREVGGESR